VISRHAVWSILLAACLIREATCVAACYHVYRYLPPRVKSVRDLVHYLPARVVTLDMMFATPVLAASAVLKIATDQVIGTDSAVTMCYLAGISLMALIYSDFSIHEFLLLTKSRNMHQSASLSSMTALYVLLSVATTVLYLFCVVLPTALMLPLDHALGPDSNNQTVLLLVRNMGVVLWLVCYLVVTYYVAHELRALIAGHQQAHSPSHTPVPTSGSSNAPGGAVADVLAHLMEAQFKVKTQTGMGAVVFTAFCIPVAWPYQQFQLALMTAIALSSSNCSLVLLRTLRASRRATANGTAPKLSSHASSRERTLASSAVAHKSTFGPPGNASVVVSPSYEQELA
jgi:hypothetical protein